MTHLTALIVAAALCGGAVACDPGPAAIADWRARCASPADALRHAERSREGLSATCDAAVLARGTGR